MQGKSYDFKSYDGQQEWNGTHVLSSFQDFKINRSQQELQTEVLVDKPPINKVKQKQTTELGQICLFCTWSPTSFQTSKTNKRFFLISLLLSPQSQISSQLAIPHLYLERILVHMSIFYYLAQKTISFHLKYLKILLSILLDFISSFTPTNLPVIHSSKQLNKSLQNN